MQWEYKVISLKELLANFRKQTSAKKRNRILERIDEALDFWGEAGWELVAIERKMAYFKKPILNDIGNEKVIINSPIYSTNYDGILIKSIDGGKTWFAIAISGGIV